MDFKNGDVCSLEVVVQYVDHGSTLVKIESANAACTVPTSSLTLVRRAPVDLATCDLSEPVAALYAGKPAKLLHRHEHEAWIKIAGAAGCLTVNITDLRPLDAPAPESEVERLRARVAQLESALGDYTDSHPLLREAVPAAAPSDAPRPMTGFFAHLTPEQKAAAQAYRGPENHGPLSRPDPNVIYEAHNAAPTCPPGHIMIGDRAVPEPMREVPRKWQPYWRVCADQSALAMRWEWDGRAGEVMWLQRGLIHSTEANARAHAEAIIALSAGEGV